MVPVITPRPVACADDAVGSALPMANSVTSNLATFPMLHLLRR
jgi:hypothetical protein